MSSSHLVLYVVLLAGFAGGCQTMTSAKALKEANELREKYEQDVNALSASRAREDQQADEARAHDQRLDKKNKALTRLSSGDSESALEMIEDIYEPPIGDPPVIGSEEDAELLSIKASALYNLDRKEEAIEAFRSAKEKNPHHRLARRNLGKILFLEKRYAEALQAWKAELSDGYRDAELLYLVGQAHYELGRVSGSLTDIEAARVSMQAVLVERPQDPELRRWMAVLEYETGRYGEAVRYLEAIRAENPLDPEYLERLGNCYHRLGERRRALDILQISARLRAPSPEGCEALAELYREHDAPGRAAEWYVRTYRSDPREAPAGKRLMVGMLLAEVGRAEEAAAWLEALEERDEGYAQSLAALIPVLRGLGKEDEALLALEKLRKSRPLEGTAHLTAGRMNLERKQLDAATEAFAKASALPETRADALAGLAEVLYAKGDLEAAHQYLRRALELKPRDGRLLSFFRQLEEEIRLSRQKDLLSRASAAEAEARPSPVPLPLDHRTAEAPRNSEAR